VQSHEQAQLLRLDGKLLESRAALQSCADDACPEVLRRDCIQWQAELSREVPTVVFEAITDEGVAAGVRVSVGGKPITHRLAGKTVELDPGRYVFRFVLPDGSVRDVESMVRQGERKLLIRADFRSPTPPATSQSALLMPQSAEVSPDQDSERRRVPTISYALGGLALVSAGVAVGFGLSTRTKERNALGGCAPDCTRARVDEIRRSAMVTDIALGVSLAAGLGAGLAYAWQEEGAEPPPVAHSVRPSIVLGPGRASAGLAGWF
jgi:hypothetical protein